MTVEEFEGLWRTAPAACAVILRVRGFQYAAEHPAFADLDKWFSPDILEFCDDYNLYTLQEAWELLCTDERLWQ